MTSILGGIEMAEEIGVEAEFSIDEPCLKYRHLDEDLPAILQITEISCVSAHQKFLVLGCKNGDINILDHMGNLVQNGHYKKHFSTVNQLDISDNGDFIISCSDDGFVNIYNLSAPNLSELVNLRRQIKSVAIAPSYGRARKFVTGDRKIVMHSRGALMRFNKEDLYQPPGYVRTIKWRGTILIWADDQAVRVYELRKRALINYIPLCSEDDGLIKNRFLCHLAWHANNCFLIGYGRTVQICQIRNDSPLEFDTARYNSSLSIDRDSNSSLSFSTTSSIHSKISIGQTVQISNRFDLNSDVICGITSHQEFILMLLWPTHSETDPPSYNIQSSSQPQVLIADVGDFLTLENNDLNSSFVPISFHEVIRENVSLSFSDINFSQNLGLASVRGEHSHIIFSPRDILYAESLSIDDRIDWLLKQNLHQRALQLAKENRFNLKIFSHHTIAMNFLDQLLSDQNYLGAAALCSEVLTDAQAWEDQVYRFLSLDQLHVLVQYLPVTSPKLSPSIYDTALLDLMSKSPEQFLMTLKLWSLDSGLFSFETLISAILEKCSSCAPKSDFLVISKDHPELLPILSALILLYEHSGCSEKGLELSIQLQDENVFDLLRRQLLGGKSTRLTMVVHKNLISLFEINIQKTILLLLDYVQEFPVDLVVQELNEYPSLLYHFLDAVNNRSPRLMLPYVPRLVELYAKYARDKLLPFLHSTDHYPLHEALDQCQRLNYVPETVYLLTRVGRRRDALKMLMEKGEHDTMLVGNDPLTDEQRRAVVAARAIAYCQEEDRSSSLYYEFSGGKNPVLRSSSKLNRKPSRLPKSSSYSSLNTICRTPGSSDAENEDYFDGDNGDDGLPPDESGELWKQVVLFAVDKPSFISALLKHASTDRIDPGLLLRKIAPNMEIPNLKISLVNLLRNTQMQIELRKNCQSILLNDSHELLTRLISRHGRGTNVNTTKSAENRGLCRLCRQPLVVETFLERDSVAAKSSSSMSFPPLGMHQPTLIVYRCSHCFHKSCLLKTECSLACPVCSQSRFTK